VSAGQIAVPKAIRELTERVADVDERIRERCERLASSTSPRRTC